MTVTLMPRLVNLIRGIPAKINLIPSTNGPARPISGDWGRIRAFAISCTRRLCLAHCTPQGEDIMAACGQLKSATERAHQGPQADRSRSGAARAAT